MVNEIKSVIKRGEVFNQSDCWVFRVTEEVFQWDIFVTDLKFIIKSQKMFQMISIQMSILHFLCYLK